jgi:large subunit ribosomal protein L14e
VSFLNLSLGEVVFSKAGRDSGRKFVITGIVDTNYVFISDGDLRRIDKPKKKKIKHLELTGIVVDSLSEKLKNNLKVTNS